MFLAAYFIYYLYSNLYNVGNDIVLYMIEIIILVINGVVSFLEGVICQIALTIFSFLGIFYQKKNY